MKKPSSIGTFFKKLFLQSGVNKLEDGEYNPKPENVGDRPKPTETVSLTNKIFEAVKQTEPDLESQKKFYAGEKRVFDSSKCNTRHFEICNEIAGIVDRLKTVEDKIVKKNNISVDIVDCLNEIGRAHV
jgi:hypothetical protein